MSEQPETRLILKVEDPNVQVRGYLPKEVAEKIVEDVWMPIKKNGLPIERSVVMLPPTYDPETDLSSFNFIVNSLALPAKSSSKTRANDDVLALSKHEEDIHRHLIQEAITAFVDALIDYHDTHMPYVADNPRESLPYA